MQKKKHSLQKTLIIILICGVAAGAWYWEHGLKDRMFPKRFGVVCENEIYRSGQIHQNLIRDVLKEHHIGMIVKLSGYAKDYPSHVAEQQAAEEMGIDMRLFPLRGNGTGELENYIGAVVSLVEAKEKKIPVLVHCAAGSQRTGGAVAFYRLLIEKQPPEEVLREMKRYDWKENDTDLLNYLNENMAAMATALQEKGIIETIPDPIPQIIID